MATPQNARSFSYTGNRQVQLPLAKRIVERFGGVIGIESERGVGTCVSLRFPVSA